MKKALKIILAILLVTTMIVSLTACKKDPCADGHTWDEGVVTTEANCTRSGAMTYTCTVCGETNTTVILAEHKLGDWIAETATELGHYHCDVCGKNFDADKQELADITKTQEPTGSEITLYWTSDAELPEYVSMYFCGGVNGWNILEAQYKDNTYSVVVTLDKSLENWDKYVIALGYNAASGLDEYGLDWKYKSNETSESDGVFDIADGAQSVDLGAQTFSSVPEAPNSDPGNEDDPVTPSGVQATFTVKFDGALPEGYNVYLVGEMTNWGPETGGSPAKMSTSNGYTYSVTLTVKSGTYEFKVVACKGDFSWTDTSAVEYGDGQNNAKVTVPANGGTVELFASVQKAPSQSSNPSKPVDPATSVEIQWVINFNQALPAGYNVYLMGTMNNWDDSNPIQLTARSGGTTYASSALIVAVGDYDYKVVVIKGSFAWEGGIEYTDHTASNGDDSKVTVAQAGDVALFEGTVQAAPTDDSVFVAHFWNFENWSQVYYHSWDGSGDYTSWPGTQIAQADADGWYTVRLETRTPSWVSGSLGIIFNSGSDANKTSDLKPTQSEVWIVGQAGKMYYSKAEAENYIKTAKPVPSNALFLVGVVGGVTDWSTTTADWDRILVADGVNYTLTISFKANDQFQVKQNVAGWDPQYGHSSLTVSGEGGISTNGIFVAGGDYGNDICVKSACTCRVSFNTSTKKIEIVVISLG